MKRKIVLASASPRRKELLSLITEDFKVAVSGADETVPQGITPLKTAEFLARIKAESVAPNFKDFCVIGADTCVIVDDLILGKPKSKSEATEMMQLLSGKTHKVVTGCAIVNSGKTDSFSVVTEVEFYQLTNSEIEEYVNTDEPYDKAGGYGIQGRAALFVKGIKGDYFNVVGLPVAELNRRLKQRKY